jgi:hypothetical protein
MLWPIIELTLRLAPALRADKAVLVAAMRKHMPQVARIPKESVNSLIDWQYESLYNESLRTFLEAHTQAECWKGTPLEDLLNKTCFEKFRDDYFASVPKPMARSSSGSNVAISVRRHLSQSPLVSPLIQLLGRAGRHTAMGKARNAAFHSSHKVLMRLAILGLFQKTECC